MVDVAPFFVVGMPRSGTTLLSAMLSAHPDIHVTPETHFFRLFCRSAKQAQRSLSPTEFRQLWEDYRASWGFKDLQFDEAALEAICERVEAAEPKTAGGIFRAVLDHVREEAGTALIGEKTPDHIFHWQAIRAVYPDARFIFILRDPRAVSQSLRTTPFNKGGGLWHANRWRRAVAAFREMEAVLGPRVVTLVRFEDLVTDPTIQMERLCTFLGVDFDPALGNWQGHDLGLFDPGRETWKTNTNNPLQAAAAEKWRQAITNEEAWLIGRAAGPELSAFSYSTGIDDAARGMDPLRIALIVLDNLWQILRAMPNGVFKALGLKRRGIA